MNAEVVHRLEASFQPSADLAELQQARETIAYQNEVLKQTNDHLKQIRDKKLRERWHSIRYADTFMGMFDALPEDRKMDAVFVEAYLTAEQVLHWGFAAMLEVQASGSDDPAKALRFNSVSKVTAAAEALIAARNRVETQADLYEPQTRIASHHASREAQAHNGVGEAQGTPGKPEAIDSKSHDDPSVADGQSELYVTVRGEQKRVVVRKAMPGDPPKPKSTKAEKKAADERSRSAMIQMKGPQEKVLEVLKSVSGIIEERTPGTLARVLLKDQAVRQTPLAKKTPPPRPPRSLNNLKKK